MSGVRLYLFGVPRIEYQGQPAMTPRVGISASEFRLARYYLDKLRMVDEAVRRGQASVSSGIAMFDQEWEHIRHWQSWTTRRDPGDTERAQLCKEYALAGLEILANRNNAVDQVTWLTDALTAAQHVEDKEAERTLCYELEMVYFRSGSLELGRKFAGKLLRLAEAANDRLSIERALFGLAVYAEERGRYSDAEAHYQRALQVSHELGIVIETGRILNALGGIANYVGDFGKAYRYCSQYLELMEIHGKTNKVCHALISAGECLIGLSAYTEADRYLQRAVSMCKSLGFQRLLGVGLLNLGALAIEQDDLETAQQYLLDGVRAVRAVGVPRQIVYGLARLGYIDIRRGNFAEALAHLHEGLEIAREVGNPRHICDVQLHLATSYLALDHLTAARSALYEALTIAQRLGLRQQQARLLAAAVAYHQRLGQHEQAAKWVGAIAGDPLVDERLFPPVCVQLEAALGKASYQHALVEGSSRTLDETLQEIIALLS